MGENRAVIWGKSDPGKENSMGEGQEQGGRGKSHGPGQIIARQLL